MNNRYQLTDTVTGEIIDLSPLARPARRTGYNRPVKRTRRPMRRADRETLWTLGLLSVAVGALLLLV